MLIAELGLTPASKRALEHAGIETVEQLQRPANDLLAIEAITGVVLHDVACRLHVNGLGLHADQKARLPSKNDLEILRLRVVEGFSLRDIAVIIDTSPEHVRQRLNVSFGLSGEPPIRLEHRRLRARRPEWERIIAFRLRRAADGLPLAVLLRGFADGPLGSEARIVLRRMETEGLLTVQADRVRPTEALSRMADKGKIQGRSVARTRRIVPRRGGLCLLIALVAAGLGSSTESSGASQYGSPEHVAPL
jgi:hypothetical protein